MKESLGQLILYGDESTRRYLWKININKSVVIESCKVFKRQQTARNDAIRWSKRLNINLN